MIEMLFSSTVIVPPNSFPEVANEVLKQPSCAIKHNLHSNKKRSLCTTKQSELALGPKT